MQNLTPYSLAFTVLRIIAVFLLIVGIWTPIGALLVKLINPPMDLQDLLFAVKDSLYSILPGALLYLLSSRLAKIATWKIKDSD